MLERVCASVFVCVCLWLSLRAGVCVCVCLCGVCLQAVRRTAATWARTGHAGVTSQRRYPLANLNWFSPPPPRKHTLECFREGGAKPIQIG